MRLSELEWELGELSGRLHTLAGDNPGIAKLLTHAANLVWAAKKCAPSTYQRGHAHGEGD